MVQRWGAWVLVGAALVAGCGTADVRRTGGEVTAVIDVEEALGETGSVRYRYTAESDDSTDDRYEVVVEGQRDVERGLSSEVSTTTITPPSREGTVDETPGAYVARRETVTRDGTTWARALGAGQPTSWAALPDLDDNDFDGDRGSRSFSALIAAAAAVERYTFVKHERMPRGGVDRRFHGVGVDPYEEPMSIDVWLDGDGRLTWVATSEGQVLDVWGHGDPIDVREPSPVDPDEDAAGRILDRDDPYPEVVGPWVVAAEGTSAGRAWKVVEAPGRFGDTEVPCRMLLTEDEGYGDEWADAELVYGDEGALCGNGGYGAGSALSDPALQVLAPVAAWEADATATMPVGLAVSPRFAGSPVVLVGLDGAEIEVALDAAGLGVAELPGTFAVDDVLLAGRSVACHLDVGWDGLGEEHHAASWLYGVSPWCVAR